MRTLSLALLLALFSPLARADEIRMPKQRLTKTFWVGVAALGASKSYDAIETRKLLDRGGWENNPVFGRHPSPAKQSLINAAFFAGQVFVFRKTELSRRKWIRLTGRAFLAVSVGEHIYYGACNAGINPASPTVRNCSLPAPFKY